jgi:nucleoredoxin
MSLSDIIGNILLSKDGTEIATNEVLAGKGADKAACILYFSAHWCPPCRGFTPAFAAAYDAYKKSGGSDAEVVFVSWDRDPDTFKEYFSEMPWLAVPFVGTEEFRKRLNEKFEVQGIPSLVALAPDGSKLDFPDEVDLRGLVSQHKENAFPMTAAHVNNLFEEKRKAQAAMCLELGKGKVVPPLLAPGGDEKESTVVDVLAMHDHLAILFSDGDLEDDTYKNLAEVCKEVNGGGAAKRLGFVYIGYMKYNDSCDHTVLYQRHHNEFYGLLAPSDDVKQQLEKITSDGVKAPHVLVLGRDGEGSLSVVSDDPGCKKLQGFGAKGYPWDLARITELQNAEKERLAALKEKQTNLQFLKGSDGRDGLFAKDGLEIKVDSLASQGPEAVIGLYFSAHWCPPCRGFTPTLAKCHKELKDAGKKFEIVFVSSDKDDAAFKEYMGEMPWVSVPYSERELAKDLNSVFEVRGIPSLILLKPDGSLITKGGREAIDFGSECFPWGDAEMEKGREEAMKKQAEKLKAALEAEKSGLEEQAKSGGPVLKRLRGSPGEAMTHDVADRTIQFNEFATIGTSESLTTSGVSYYEIEVCEAGGIPQIGFAAPAFETCDGETCEGVGDDKVSWGFDGARRVAWFGGTVPWACEWGVGDVIGLAANVDLGKIAVSKNGNWTEAPLGVFFHNDLIKSGVYPCLTARGYKVRYNLNGTTHGPFKHGPPSVEQWGATAGYPSS